MKSLSSGPSWEEGVKTQSAKLRSPSEKSNAHKYQDFAPEMTRFREIWKIVTVDFFL